MNQWTALGSINDLRREYLHQQSFELVERSVKMVRPLIAASESAQVTT